MARIPSLNPLRGRGTKMRGAGRKAFKVPTTKTTKAPKLPKMKE